MSTVGDPKDAFLVSNNRSEYNDLESNQDAPYSTDPTEVLAKGGECDVDCKLLMYEVGRTVPDGTRNCPRVLRACCCGRIPDGQTPEYLRLSFGIFTVIEAIAFLWCFIQYFVFQDYNSKDGANLYLPLLSGLTLVLNFLISGVWVVTVTKLPQTCCCSRSFNAVCFFLFQVRTRTKQCDVYFNYCDNIYYMTVLLLTFVIVIIVYILFVSDRAHLGFSSFILYFWNFDICGFPRRRGVWITRR